MLKVGGRDNHGLKTIFAQEFSHVNHYRLSDGSNCVNRSIILLGITIFLAISHPPTVALGIIISMHDLVTLNNKMIIKRKNNNIPTVRVRLIAEQERSRLGLSRYRDIESKAPEIHSYRCSRLLITITRGTNTRPARKNRTLCNGFVESALSKTRRDLPDGHPKNQ